MLLPFSGSDFGNRIKDPKVGRCVTVHVILKSTENKRIIIIVKRRIIKQYLLKFCCRK